MVTSGRSAHLRHKTISSTLAVWNGDSDAAQPRLAADGTAVVTQANGQVCILKLHHGQRRVSLDAAEAILLPPLRQDQAARLAPEEAKEPWQTLS
jgi:hypothetical protein